MRSTVRFEDGTSWPTKRPVARRSIVRWRSRSAGDLSLGMLATFTLGIALWLVFGLATSSGPVVAANTVTLVLNLVLVGLRLRFGGARRRHL